MDTKTKKLIDKIESENSIKELNLKYDLEVIPYARPRKGKYGAFYNPRQKYKKDLVKLFSNDFDSSIFPIKGEVSLSFVFGINPPLDIKNSKSKMSLIIENILHPITRPDTDNYIKPILDALNGILYEDDGQVYKISATKKYTTDKPYLKIKIKFRENVIKLR